MGLPPLKVTDQDGNSNAATLNLELPDGLRVQKNGVKSSLLEETVRSPFSLLKGDSSDFELSTGDWTTYNDGASPPIDGTLGTSLNLFINHATAPANVLNGVGSLALIKLPTGDAEGSGISVDRPVPAFYYGKQMQVSFKYRTSTGYTSNNLRVFAYDITNNNLLVVRNYDGIGQLGASGSLGSKFTGYLTIPGGCQNIRLIIHSTLPDPTGSWTAWFDDIKIEEVQMNLVTTGGPVGEIIALGTDVTPPDFVPCDGQALDRSTYRALFSAIGTRFGAPSASTFNVPDLRGRFLRGADDMNTLAGAAGRDPNSGTRTAMNTGGATGNTVGSVQLDAYDSHFHSIPAHDHGGGDHTHVIEDMYKVGNEHDAGGLRSAWEHFAGTDNATVASGNIITPEALATDAAGGNETRPKNAYVNYYIRFREDGNIVTTAQADVRTMKVKASIVTPQSHAGGSYLPISWTVDEDTHGAFDGTTFTMPFDGSVNIEGFVSFGANANGGRALRAFVNGSINEPFWTTPSAGGAYETGSAMSRTLKLSEGETVVIQGFQDSGVPLSYSLEGALEITARPDFSMFALTGTTEYLEVTSAANVVTTTQDTWEPVVAMQLDLTAGTWQIGYDATMGFVNQSLATQFIAGNIVIARTTGERINRTISHNGENVLQGSGANRSMSRQTEITITQDVSYNLQIRCNRLPSTAICSFRGTDVNGLLSNPDSSSVFWARRVK